MYNANSSWPEKPHPGHIDAASAQVRVMLHLVVNHIEGDLQSVLKGAVDCTDCLEAVDGLNLCTMLDRQNTSLCARQQWGHFA